MPNNSIGTGVAVQAIASISTNLATGDQDRGMSLPGFLVNTSSKLLPVQVVPLSASFTSKLPLSANCSLSILFTCPTVLIVPIDSNPIAARRYTSLLVR